MIVVNIQYMKGISKKNNQPYEFHRVQGIERDHVNGGLRCRDYMVSPVEFQRNPFDVGSKIEIFQSGAVYIQDTHGFDFSALEAAL